MFVADRWASVQIIFEELHPAVAKLALLTGRFAWGKRFPFFLELHVAFDRGGTPKVRAASSFEIPRSRTAATIFSLRSTEYAFMR